MPKVLIKGNGKESFDYLVSCNICKSVLLCNETDIKTGKVLEVCDVSYNIEMVFCEICQKDIEFRENTIYVLPSGLIKIFPEIQKESIPVPVRENVSIPIHEQEYKKNIKRKNIDINVEKPVKSINISNPIDIIIKSTKRMKI